MTPDPARQLTDDECDDIAWGRGNRVTTENAEGVRRLIRAAYAAGREAMRAECEQLRYERDHCHAHLDCSVKLLTGIHGLLYPPRFKDGDGVTFQFHSPHVHEQMQALSDRIRALPDEIASIRALP